MILSNLIKFILIVIPKYYLKKIFYKKKNRTSFSKNQSYYFHELKKKGYVVIKNYVPQSECKLIIHEMNKYYRRKKKDIWESEDKSEYRMFGAEKIGKKINNFFFDKFVINIGSKYFGRKLNNLMTMANRIVSSKNNLGSGGGWHRDDVTTQFKAILYLTNVSKDTGAFELVEKSNKLFYLIFDALMIGINILNTRITNEKVKLLSKNRKKIILGRAGTLILVDTSLIHRGRPLKKSNRYALTNYYYPYYQLNKMKNHFKPRIKKTI